MNTKLVTEHPRIDLDLVSRIVYYVKNSPVVAEKGVTITEIARGIKKPRNQVGRYVTEYIKPYGLLSVRSKGGRSRSFPVAEKSDGKYGNIDDFNKDLKRNCLKIIDSAKTIASKMPEAIKKSLKKLTKTTKEDNPDGRSQEIVIEWCWDNNYLKDLPKFSWKRTATRYE